MSASKKLGPRAHVDVNDRRLKPIYECLDNGDNKKAIQEADRVLKKAKQQICAKALKCLAMIRLGRKAEARVLLAEIRKVPNVDESTLQALTASYKELLDFGEIVHVYEESLACNPNDEATLTQLFNAYVRIGDCQNQQQIAMKLYKLFPNKTPYLFWVIMSYVMMSDRDNKAGKKLYLPLAEGMTLKYLKEAKHESESEIMVYTSILDKQEKYKELLDILKGPMGDEMVQNFKYKTLLQIRTLRNLSDWKGLNITFKRLLLQNLDDILWYREYLNYALILTGYPPSETLLSEISFLPSSAATEELKNDVKEDDSVESIVKFLKLCVKSSMDSSQGYLLRAPYLAQLEFIKMIWDVSTSSWINNLAPQYLELLANYFKIFGDKPCCFNDLKLFFNILNHEQKVELKKMFAEILTGINGSFSLPEDYKSMQRHIFTLQASHYMGFYESLPTHEQLQLVESLVKFYHHGLKFGKNLTSTDIQPSDPYVLLSGEILYILAVETDDALHLIRAISLLEMALEKSPSNHFVKLLLVKYHGMLGTLSQGYQVYETLDVKHIQNDTLGYIVCHPLVRFGQFQTAKKYCDSALKFFESVQREVTDFIINCYKYGTFDKIKEFIELRRKLTRSIQFASISVNKVMLKIIDSCHDPKATEELVSSCDLEEFIFHGMDCKMFFDNRDFKVISDWKLFGSQQRGLQAKFFEEEKMWLMIQTLTLSKIWQAVDKTRMLTSQQSCSNNSANSSFENSDDAKNLKGSRDKPSHVPRSGNEMFLNDSTSVVEDAVNEVTSRLAFCSLFDEDDAQLSVFRRVSLEAKELVDGMSDSYVESFFRTPLKVFIDKKLSSSFVQFIEFFNSVIEVIGNHPSDKCQVLIKKASDVVAHELRIRNPESNGKEHFSLKGASCLEEAVLLVQHLSQVVVIFNCCDLLLQPYKSKRSKKKSKKQLDIPNIMQSYNFLAQGLISLHAILTDFFKKTSETFSPNLLPVIDNLEETKSEDSLKVVKAAKQGFIQLKDDMSELLHRIGSRVDKFKEKDPNDVIV